MFKDYGTHGTNGKIEIKRPSSGGRLLLHQDDFRLFLRAIRLLPHEIGEIEEAVAKSLG
jgi:hypothetical protein